VKHLKKFSKSRNQDHHKGTEITESSRRKRSRELAEILIMVVQSLFSRINMSARHRLNALQQHGYPFPHAPDRTPLEVELPAVQMRNNRHIGRVLHVRIATVNPNMKKAL
jgi:hypothetical protein